MDAESTMQGGYVAAVGRSVQKCMLSTVATVEVEV